LVYKYYYRPIIITGSLTKRAPFFGVFSRDYLFASFLLYIMSIPIYRKNRYTKKNNRYFNLKHLKIYIYLNTSYSIIFYKLYSAVTPRYPKPLLSYTNNDLECYQLYIGSLRRFPQGYTRDTGRRGGYRQGVIENNRGSRRG
jgi:hypothetical protein